MKEDLSEMKQDIKDIKEAVAAIPVINERISHLTELKPEIKANTKFRHYVVGFAVILTGLLGVVISTSKLNLTEASEAPKIEREIK